MDVHGTSRTLRCWLQVSPALLILAIIVIAVGSIGWIFAETERQSNPAGTILQIAQRTTTHQGRAGATDEILKNFLTHAYYHGRAELVLSEMASIRAVRPEVKQFAGAVITDQHRTDTDLFTLAKKKGIAINRQYRVEENPLYRDMLSEIALLSGPEFDVAYLEQTADNCKLELQQYLHLASTASDDETQLFAAQQVSRVRNRLLQTQEVLKHSQKGLTARALPESFQLRYENQLARRVARFQVAVGLRGIV